MNFDPNGPQEAKVEYFRDRVRNYIDAVNAGDIEHVLSLYADDAEVHDPVGQRNFSGKTALQAFYKSVIARPATLRIVGPIRGSFGNVVATPILAIVPGMNIDVITLTCFNDAGLIQDYAAYWGPMDVRKTDT